MAAKKAPAKKMPAKKAAPAKKRAAGDSVSDKQAEAMVKQGFMAQVKEMGPMGIRKYAGETEGLVPKQKGTAAQWARAVDNAMGDTWFEGGAAAKIGMGRASKILAKNRNKWIKSVYDGSSGPTVAKKKAGAMNVGRVVSKAVKSAKDPMSGVMRPLPKRNGSGKKK